jgi:uncharacterized protein involved in exopolysaccharide biosynthesis/Mrp family chromosome partitioning ATPase
MDPAQSLRSHYEAVTLRFLHALWRRKWLVSALVLAALCAGLFLLPFLPKQYSSHALIKLDLNKSNPAEDAAPANVVLDPAALIEGEATLIRSRAIGRRVVDSLGLLNDPAYAPRESRRDMIVREVRTVAAMLGFGQETTTDNNAPTDDVAKRTDLIVSQLMDKLKVVNGNRSYLISVEYTSDTPESAASIANAFADEYLSSRVEASFTNATRTRDWLGSQIASVESDLTEADRAVQDFREKYGFIETGGAGAGVEEQQMSELTTQLNAATSDRLAQSMRLQRIKDTIAAGQLPSAADVAEATVLAGLIDSKLAAEREIATQTTAYGAKHPSVTRAQSALADIKRQIDEELTRLISTIEDDVASAVAVEDELKARVASVQQGLIQRKSRERELRNLQEHADALRDRLKTLTDSYNQANAVAELKPIAAEMVMAAEPVAIPSSPNPRVVLGLSLLAALGGSVFLVFLLERRENGFRTESEVSEELNVPCVAMLPSLSMSANDSDSRSFYESIRSVAAAVTPGSANHPPVILVTSALPGEGKSVLIRALAECLTIANQNVLILNASSPDHTPPTAFPASAPLLRLTLSQLMSEDQSTEKLLLSNGDKKPVLIHCDGQDKQDEFGSPAFKAILEEARSLYDVILIEAPPVMLFPDAQILAKHADFVLHTIQWNHTSRGAVDAALRKMATVSIRPNGAVLTNVNVRQHKKYGLIDEIYYRRKYAKRLAA